MSNAGRILMYTAHDGKVEVDGVVKTIPELSNTDLDLRAVTWDGQSGLLIYKGFTEAFSDRHRIDYLFKLWDEAP